MCIIFQKCYWINYVTLLFLIYCYQNMYSAWWHFSGAKMRYLYYVSADLENVTNELNNYRLLRYYYVCARTWKKSLRKWNKLSVDCLFKNKLALVFILLVITDTLIVLLIVPFDNLSKRGRNCTWPEFKQVCLHDSISRSCFYSFTFTFTQSVRRNCFWCFEAYDRLVSSSSN